MSDKRIFIISGESSGEAHGAELALELLKIDPTLEIHGVGGAAMRRAGIKLIANIDDLAVVGFSEVIGRFAVIRRIFRMLVETLSLYRPNLLVLIDYPDFNLRLGKAAKAMGIDIAYYISPQVWAWRKGRITTLKAMVKKMLVILPFEEDLYKKAGIPVRYVGHPLVKRVSQVQDSNSFMAQYKLRGDKTYVALLPGSRMSELDRMLELFLQSAHLIHQAEPAVEFLLPVASSIHIQPVEQAIGASRLPIKAIRGNSIPTLKLAKCAIVASGTATMEAALCETPMVVVYKVSATSYRIARWLVDVPFIAMPNLIAGRQVVAELIQDDAKPKAISSQILDLLQDQHAYKQKIEALRGIRSILGNSDASATAAREIHSLID